MLIRSKPRNDRYSHRPGQVWRHEKKARALSRERVSGYRTIVLDNLPGGALNSIGMLPTEHNDPINEKILAISEDKIYVLPDSCGCKPSRAMCESDYGSCCWMAEKRKDRKQ
jgi:hypothetical protein